MLAATRFYRDSIYPGLTYKQLLTDYRMYVSVLVHSLLYVSILYGISTVLFRQYIATNKWVSLWLFLVIIMWVGYPFRLWRAKGVFQYEKSIEKTNTIMDNGYFCWYFLA